MKTNASPTFPPTRDFKNASLYELLKARDQWHLPLSSMRGVIGTAVGLYRFHDDDSAALGARKANSKPRRFATSSIGPDSWPCVLVLVDEWHSPSDFEGGKAGDVQNLAHLVPQFLYTQEGLVVPTCVIEVELAERKGNVGRANPHFYPTSLLGGGAPLIRDDQGIEKVGLAACLVRDNARSYVLTAAHVAGEDGTPLRCPRGAGEVLVGRSTARRVYDVPTAELYSEWRELKSRQMVDAALVEVDEIEEWTSQVYLIGDIGRAPDFNALTITLALLGKPLVMCGPDSSLLRGEVLGLFPRYKTVGGIDYCADLLIGPSDGSGKGGAMPREGCSGGLWFFERQLGGDKKEYLPVGLDWGLMDLRDGSSPVRLSLATFASNALSMLGVEIETGRNSGYGPVWGMKVHPAFADIVAESLDNAPELAPDLAPFKEFLFGGSREEREEALASLRMLSVLPDEWSHGNRMGRDNPNHYADVDLSFGGRKLKDVPPTVDGWSKFYEDVDPKCPKGALPFRVGQIFTALTCYADRGDFEDFFAAAGILLHYAADASNPAHVSSCSQGNPAWPKKDGYHSLWDNAVIDRGLASSEALLEFAERSAPLSDEMAARRAALEVMNEVLGIIDVSGTFALPYDDKASAMKAVRDFLKSDEGMQATASCAGRSVALWLRLVRSALGKLELPAIPNYSRKVDHDRIYRDGSFLKSLRLGDYAR